MNFKKGDRVKCRDAAGLHEVEMGKSYVVEDITTEHYGTGIKIRKETVDELAGYDDMKRSLWWREPEDDSIGTFNAKRFKLDLSYIRKQKLNKLYGNG